MDKQLRVLVVFACALAAGADRAGATAYASAGAGNWSTASHWSPNGVPGSGDTVTITHAITQDVAGLVVGVNGAAPASMYLLDIAPSGSGYTNSACTLTLTGGTAIGISTTPVTDCIVIGGVVTPKVYYRGAYSVCPTSYTITGLTGGSGAVTSGTPSCAATGTAAVAVGQGGSLTVAADTYVRGTLLGYGNSGNTSTFLTVNPGANLYMDMTQAAGAIYRIESARPIVASCASAQCSIQGYGGATAIHPGTTGGTGTTAATITANNVLFQRVGDAGHYFAWVGRNGSSIVNSIFDTCGIFFLQGMTGADTFTFTGNLFRNTAVQNARKPTINFFSQTSASKTTGTRVMTGNAFDGAMDSPVSNGANQVTDFTITGNSFGEMGSASGVWSAFSGNLQRVAPNYYGNYTVSGFGGSMSYVYTWIDTTIASNPHVYNPGANNTITNGLFGQSANEIQDSGEWLVSAPIASTSGTETFTNNVFLCSAEGIGPSEIGSIRGFSASISSASLSGGVVTVTTASTSGAAVGATVVLSGTSGITGLNATFTVASVVDATHFTVSCPGCSGTAATGGSELNSASFVITNNTFCGGYADFPWVNLNEASNSVPGSLTLRNNLGYALSASSSLKTHAYGGPGPADICATTSATASNCDYNAAYNYAATQTTGCGGSGCTNQGRGYGGAWSYMPGAHDVDGQNPNFVDAGIWTNHGRKLENFDQGYLAKPLAAPWAAGGTYNYGDLVSNTVSTMYNGEALNYRCKAVAGCKGAPAPGWNAANGFNAATASSITVAVPAAANLTGITAAGNLFCLRGSTTITPTSIATSGAPITGVTINYNSTDAVGCWVTSNWRNYWEFAGYHWLRTQLYARTTFSDPAIGCAGCTALQALNNWIIAGQAPRKAAFQATGYGGANLGAVTPTVTAATPGPILW